MRSVGHHPHCVRYFAAWEERGYMYIQTELCERGTYVRNVSHFCVRLQGNEGSRLWARAFFPF